MFFLFVEEKGVEAVFGLTHSGHQVIRASLLAVWLGQMEVCQVSALGYGVRTPFAA